MGSLLSQRSPLLLLVQLLVYSEQELMMKRCNTLIL